MRKGTILRFNIPTINYKISDDPDPGIFLGCHVYCDGYTCSVSWMYSHGNVVLILSIKPMAGYTPSAIKGIGIAQTAGFLFFFISPQWNYALILVLLFFLVPTTDPLLSTIRPSLRVSISFHLQLSIRRPHLWYHNGMVELTDVMIRAS